MKAYALNPSFMFSYAEARKEQPAKLHRDNPEEVSSAELLPHVERWLGASPSRAEAWAWRGLLRRRGGDYRGAVRDLRRAWSLGARDPMILAWRGEARLQAGDAAGMAELERAATLGGRAWIHAWLGRAKVSFARSPQALVSFDRALELEPDNGWYLAWRAEAKRILGIHDGMLEDFDRALAQDPGYDYAAWVRTWRGLACLKVGSMKEALRDFSAALEGKPSYALAWNGLARAHWNLGRLKSWAVDMDRAAVLDPKYVELWFSRPPAELETFACRLEVVKPSTAMRRWRGFFLLLLGRLNESCKELESAASRESGNVWGWAWLGLAAAQAGRHEEASSRYERFLEIHPGNPLVLAWRAKAFLAQGRIEEALADFQESVRSDPRFAWILTDLGRVELLFGRPAPAASHLEKALLMDGRDALAWADLSEAFRRLGKRRAGRRALKRALEEGSEAARCRLKEWERSVC
ncbi:MAG: tetratricopeptide repeat protein [Elusimicrobia bacterium]|nr:tetratricopeptide repeat protein [Elusimicrobiota bacterium]